MQLAKDLDYLLFMLFNRFKALHINTAMVVAQTMRYFPKSGIVSVS